MKQRIGTLEDFITESKKDFAIRYQMFKGKDGEVVTKEKFFPSKEKLDAFVDKIVDDNNFKEILAFSDGVEDTFNESAGSQTITMSAFAEDYSEKAWKFLFGRNQFEFVPKSQAIFVESAKKGEEFDNGGSNYFEIPLWLFKKLKGTEFYGTI